MHRARKHNRFACRLVFASIWLLAAAPVHAQLRPNPTALDAAPTDLLERLRADPLAYFRFINREWIARVCEVFKDVHDMPNVRLHGDAHLEQFAVTKDAWGLDDFDDSARGPGFVDIVRFMGSIDLATRQRGWTRARDALRSRFLEGYRHGLSDPVSPLKAPDIVGRLRAQAPATHEAFLAWGDAQMQLMDEATLESVVSGMERFEHFIRRERPDLRSGYFSVVRAGWLRIGVGSATIGKVLIRVQGPTPDPGDDVFVEAKEVTSLDGLGCLEGPTLPAAVRIIDGARQLGRLKRDILAVGPGPLIAAATSAEHWREWWISSWDPSYRELRVSDLRSVKDLADIAYDSGLQLGAGDPQDTSVRQQALASVIRLDRRLRQETTRMVEELLAEWRELAQR
jgi:hypothetical protein